MSRAHHWEISGGDRRPPPSGRDANSLFGCLIVAAAYAGAVVYATVTIPRIVRNARKVVRG